MTQIWATQWILVLSCAVFAVNANAAFSTNDASSGVSEWEHQAPIDTLEISLIYNSESDKATPSSANIFSAGSKTGSQYGLKAEYGYMQSLTFGVQGKYANDSVSLTGFNSQSAASVQTNGLVGFSAFIKGNADFTSGTVTYGVQYHSVNSDEVFTPGACNCSLTGYDITPSLGLEFWLTGAVTGLQVQYVVMGNQSLVNELNSPTTTETVKGGNAVKGTLFYEENFQSFKLGAAFTYVSAADTQDNTSSATDNDANTSLIGTIYIPIYFADSAAFLPSANYTAQTYSSSLSAVKSDTQFNANVALRVGF